MEENTPQEIKPENTVKEYAHTPYRAGLKLFAAQVDGKNYFTLADDLEEAQMHLALHVPWGSEVAPVSDSVFVLPIASAFFDGPDASEMTASLEQLQEAVGASIDAALMVPDGESPALVDDAKKMIFTSLQHLREAFDKKIHESREQVLHVVK